MYEGRIHIPAKSVYHSADTDHQSANTNGDEPQVSPDINQTEDCYDVIQTAQDDQDWIQANLIQLYIFADRRDVPLLRKDVLTSLIVKRERKTRGGKTWAPTSTNFPHVRLAFENLPKDSCLLRYLIAEAAWFWTDEHFADKDLHTLPADFLASVLSAGPAVEKKREEGWRGYAPWREALCVYHEHGADGDAIARCVQAHRELQGTLRGKMVQVLDDEAMGEVQRFLF